MNLWLQLYGGRLLGRVIEEHEQVERTYVTSVPGVSPRLCIDYLIINIHPH